jgi:hypothetical protein
MALTPWQQDIYNRSRTRHPNSGRQGTVQDMVELAGLPPTPESYDRVLAVLSENGLSAPLTRAENQANLAVAAGAGMKPLTAYQMGIYAEAKASGQSARDVAQSFNTQYSIPVKEQDVLDILYGAGLSLDERKPHTSPGVTAPPTATTPQAPEFNGGLPGRQPDGAGMYGATPVNPVNVPGQIPNSPSLRGVFAHARRRQSAGWRGQTDTILTSGRGVLDSAVLRKKVLLGS